MKRISCVLAMTAAMFVPSIVRAESEACSEACTERSSHVGHGHGRGHGHGLSIPVIAPSPRGVVHRILGLPHRLLSRGDEQRTVYTRSPRDFFMLR